MSWVLCHGLEMEQFLQEQGVDKEEMKASLIQKQNKSTWNVNYLVENGICTNFSFIQKMIRGLWDWA